MYNVPENIDSVLKTFIVGVQEMLREHLKKIILYGSYARGDYNESSDIDIMILTDINGKELENKEFEMWNLAYDLEYDYHFKIHLSPILINMDTFNSWLDVKPFYMNVQKEGVVLRG